MSLFFILPSGNRPFFYRPFLFLFFFMFSASFLAAKDYYVNDEINNIHYTIEIPTQFNKLKTPQNSDAIQFQHKTDYFLIYFSHVKLDLEITLEELTSGLLKEIRKVFFDKGLTIVEFKRKEVSINKKTWIKLDFKTGQSSKKENSVSQTVYTTIHEDVAYLAIATWIEFDKNKSKVFRNFVQSLNIKTNNSLPTPD